jgi:hypothetical protein
MVTTATAFIKSELRKTDALQKFLDPLLGFPAIEVPQT